MTRYYTAGEILRMIAEGYSVIEGSGEFITIQSPFEGDEPEELIVDVRDYEAPETPADLMNILAVWHHQHEARPAGLKQTAMTALYSKIRDLLDEFRGDQQLREHLLALFPDLQKDVWAANSLPHIRNQSE